MSAVFFLTGILAGLIGGLGVSGQAGLCELLTPTNGALMAIVVAARVKYQDGFKFAVPLYVMLMVLGAVAVVVGIGVGLR